MVTPKPVPPELDLAKIKRFCDRRVPTHLRDKVRVELEVRGGSVTILAGPEWTRLPIARLRHVAARDVWELDWCDPIAIFWG